MCRSHTRRSPSGPPMVLSNSDGVSTTEAPCLHTQVTVARPGGVDTPSPRPVRKMDESRKNVTTPRATRHRILRADSDVGEYDEIEGRLLGFATSRRDYHNHDLPRDFQKHGEGWKCSACRWFEVSIIYVPHDETYALYTVGRSELPGEDPRPRVQFTESPHELIEML